MNLLSPIKCSPSEYICIVKLRTGEGKLPYSTQYRVKSEFDITEHKTHPLRS